MALSSDNSMLVLGSTSSFVSGSTSPLVSESSCPTIKILKLPEKEEIKIDKLTDMHKSNKALFFIMNIMFLPFARDSGFG